MAFIMDTIEQILKNKRYKDQITQLDNELLESIANNHIRALEEAWKGIKQEEPERIDDIEYLQAMADGMQSLAQKVLEERTKISPSN